MRLKLFKTFSLCDSDHFYCWHAIVLRWFQKRFASEAALATRFCSHGSIPSAINFLASSRFKRASDKETSGYKPNAKVSLYLNGGSVTASI